MGFGDCSRLYANCFCAYFQSYQWILKGPIKSPILWVNLTPESRLLVFFSAEDAVYWWSPITLITWVVSLCYKFIKINTREPPGEQDLEIKPGLGFLEVWWELLCLIDESGLQEETQIIRISASRSSQEVSREPVEAPVSERASRATDWEPHVTDPTGTHPSKHRPRPGQPTQHRQLPRQHPPRDDSLLSLWSCC